MGLNRVFIDSDCLLDVLLIREPFYIDSRDLLLAKQQNDIDLSTSALAIANINYILTKDLKDKKLVKEKLKLLTTLINIVAVDSEDVFEALNSEFQHFEDAVQNSVARKNGCEFLVTRNLKDYKQSDLKVLSPKQFWDTVDLK